MPVRAITLDLDETLWPIWPVIQRAEQVTHAWLGRHAPRTAAQFDVAALRQLRNAVAEEHPEQAHDFSWQRRTSLARALRLAGEDPALAAPAFEVFFAERQRVTLFDEVPQALAGLSQRWPVFALTNGNADLQRMGLADHFVGGLTAREFGAGKPEARFFHAACQALGCAPDEVLHVGDDWALDVEGALQAGLRAAWVRRAGHPDRPASATLQPHFETPDLLALLTALTTTEHPAK